MRIITEPLNASVSNHLNRAPASTRHLFFLLHVGDERLRKLFQRRTQFDAVVDAVCLRLPCTAVAIFHQIQHFVQTVVFVTITHSFVSYRTLLEF